MSQPQSPVILLVISTVQPEWFISRDSQSVRRTSSPEPSATPKHLQIYSHVHIQLICRAYIQNIIHICSTRPPAVPRTKAYHWVCGKCGKPCQPVRHLVPSSRGGVTSLRDQPPEFPIPNRLFIRLSMNSETERNFSLARSIISSRISPNFADFGISLRVALVSRIAPVRFSLVHPSVDRLL